jgi:LmbE family N-acetylglucosaminyl deacetylase
MNFINKRIMLVVAHPDDEILGVGATMNKLINEYSLSVHVVILGEGITSRSDKRDVEFWNIELEKHRSDIQEAKKHIGFENVSIYNLPDNRFDTVALLDIIKIIEQEKFNFNPDIIFTHHGGDLNIDHQRTFEAVMTSCRPLADEMVKTIITFETPSGTEWKASTDPNKFSPNLYIEIDENNLNAKILAMESYTFEKRDYPHPRSPKALKVKASQIGINIGSEYAEAFCIIRTIQ